MGLKPRPSLVTPEALSFLKTFLVYIHIWLLPLLHIEREKNNNRLQHLQTIQTTPMQSLLKDFTSRVYLMVLLQHVRSWAKQRL